MTSRVEGGVTYMQTFDIENRLSSVTVNSQTTTFAYDGDGNLVKKLKPDGTITVYIGGIYEVDLDAGGSVTKKTSYYPAGGAMRVEVVGGSNTLYYMLKDHLGSASITLDASGNVVANGEQRYYPFGESRITSAALPTDRLFTGQRFVDGTGGLYHYGARFYLPKVGRFVSADTVVSNPKNPQSYNRYAYVDNNPLKYVDPTGHEACYGVGPEIGSEISQADCWAWGRDKWQLGLPVGTPAPGEGYSTERGVANALIDFFGINNNHAEWVPEPICFQGGCGAGAMWAQGRYLFNWINDILSPQAVQDLLTEIDWWLERFDQVSDLTKLAEFAGLSAEVATLLGIAAPEIGVPAGIVLFGAGMTVDWTAGDLEALRYALAMASEGGNAPVHLNAGSYVGGWGISVDGDEAVSHWSVHPLLTPKGVWNATPLWLAIWYTFDYKPYYP